MESWSCHGHVGHYGSAFVTNGKQSSRKDCSFPAEMPLIKSVRAANRQSPPIPRKFVASHHRNTKIRMRSDERDKLVSFPIIFIPINFTPESTKKSF